MNKGILPDTPSLPAHVLRIFNKKNFDKNISGRIINKSRLIKADTAEMPPKKASGSSRPFATLDLQTH